MLKKLAKCFEYMAHTYTPVRNLKYGLKVLVNTTSSKGKVPVQASIGQGVKTDY
jgi:hypothetical protein